MQTPNLSYALQQSRHRRSADISPLHGSIRSQIRQTKIFRLSPNLLLVFVSFCMEFDFGSHAATSSSESETFFETKIRPVLMDTCFKCHGGKETKRGLRVDSRETLLKGGENGPAIVPGDPDKSLLIQVIRRAHDEIKMAPKKKLPPETVADFVAWVNQGAEWPQTLAPDNSGHASRITHHTQRH